MTTLRRILSCFVILMVASLAAWASAPVKLYPGVGRLVGANNTAWRSSAVLHNPTASIQSALVELLPRGTAAASASHTVQLAPGETREITNLYEFLGAEDGAGMLRVTGSVIAWVRAYNEGSGTFGQDLPAVSPGAGFAPGSAMMFPFSTPTDVKRDFRSNLMLVNLGASDVTVTIVSGASIKTQVVPAGAYVQISNLGAFLGASPGFGTAHVSADGEWFGVISTVDAFTGDPTTVRGLASSDPGERYFPGIARIAGTNGAAWRSEAVFHNPTDVAITAQLDLIPRGESQIAASTSVPLAPGETHRIGDLYDLLGVADGAGTLKVTGAALAWVRTYNQRPRPGDTAVETFGQDLPAVASEGGIHPHAFIALPFNSPANTATGFRSNLVLLNLEDHDITVSLRAGGITKTRAVSANAYVQIDKLGEFLGAPVGESCVWGTADGRWATAISTVDPLTNDPTTFRAVEEWRPPSSSDLIDSALANGTINSEQALTYKVFADFQDPRLPVGLRGDDRGIIEPGSINLASAQFASLSTATQDLIGPYLVPPFLKGSWWDLRHGGGNVSASSSSAATSTCRPWRGESCGFLSILWESVTGAHVRVWFLRWNRGTDLDIAKDLVDQAESHIWTKLITVMGTQPLLTDLGDGSHLDIALVDELGSLGLTTPSPGQCREVKTSIEIRRTIPDVKVRRATLAHEMMHAAQFSLRTDFCSPDYDWLFEATATWFEDHSYPDYNTAAEQPYAWVYLDSTELSLDNKSVRNRKNSSYLFFFYLTRVRQPALAATVIGDIWRATQTMDALAAVDAGIRENGTDLDVLWPDFALYCWNEASPYNKYLTLDTLKDKAEMQRDLEANSAPDGSIPLDAMNKLDLPYLSIRYFRFTFTKPEVSTIAFWNGETFDLDVRQHPLFGKHYAAELANAELIKGGHVSALIKIKGVWTHEDLTKTTFRPFCRDMTNERIEELVIIISNSEFQDRARILKPPGRLASLLWESNMGCWRWKGQVTLRTTGVTFSYAGDPIYFNYLQEAQVTFTRRPDLLSQIGVDYELTTGNETLTISGGCTGHGTFAVFGDRADLFTDNFIHKDGEFRRTYVGQGPLSAEHAFRTVDITCPGAVGGPVAEYHWWLFPPQPMAGFPIPNARLVKVTADGKSLDDSYEPNPGGGVWRWNLRAERQP